jgi:hypothetical protein
MDDIKIDLHDSDITHRNLLYNGFSKNPRIPHHLPAVNDHSHSVHLHGTPLHGTPQIHKKLKILHTKHDPVEAVEEEVLRENLDTEKEHIYKKQLHFNNEYETEHVSLHSQVHSQVPAQVPNPINENNDTPPPPKEKVIWRSCCFQLDPKGVAYAGQFTISMTVLGISTYMLFQADGDCNKSSPYIGLISFLLGKILSTVVSSA